MKRLYLLLFLIVISFGVVFAQDPEIKPFVSAYLQDDLSQTIKAEETFSKINAYHDVNKYRTIVAKLYQYLQEHSHPRLKSRVLMLDIYGRTLHRLKITDEEYDKVREGIKIAHQLKDDQLLAEWYALAGEINLDKGYLLYNLKSVQLQEKIGFQYFSFVQTRFYSISYALYKTADYKESIAIGRRFLTLRNINTKRLDPNVHILLLDIIGACYKKLEKYDSTRYYYQKILDTLPKIKINDPIELWEGIANGNIGQALAMQKRYEQAIPLINQHLQAGLNYQSYNNVAIAQNALARIYAEQGKIQAAIAGYRKAYYWAKVSDRLAEKIAATEGLFKNYRLQNLSDSAYKYNELYYQYKDTLGVMLNREKLAVINSKIAFDDAQTNLKAANQIISRQLLTRNFILVCIALLTVIALLVYNRKMLKQKNEAAEIERQRKLAEIEVLQARKQIISFTESIIEKEKLIEKLQSQNHNNPDIVQHLSSYNLLTDVAWDEFRLEFAKAYPRFFNKLKSELTQITPAEERLAALLYLQLNANQISGTLGISKESVGRSKRRLKNRLNLPSNTPLEDYLQHFLA